MPDLLQFVTLFLALCIMFFVGIAVGSYLTGVDD